jgi:hypothetical protein
MRRPLAALRAAQAVRPVSEPASCLGSLAWLMPDAQVFVRVQERPDEAPYTVKNVW